MYYLVPNTNILTILNKYLLNLTYIVYNVSNKNQFFDLIHYYPDLKLYKIITREIKLQYELRQKYILLLFEENEQGYYHLINEINNTCISIDKFIANQTYEITTMKLNNFTNMYSKEDILKNKYLSEDWLELHRYNDFARKNYEDIKLWDDDVFIKDASIFFNNEKIILPLFEEILPENMRLKLA